MREKSRFQTTVKDDSITKLDPLADRAAGAPGPSDFAARSVSAPLTRLIKGSFYPPLGRDPRG